MCGGTFILSISRGSFGVRLKNSVLDLQPLTRFQTAILMRVQDVFFGTHFCPQLLSVQDVPKGVKISEFPNVSKVAVFAFSLASFTVQIKITPVRGGVTLSLCAALVRL